MSIDSGTYKEPTLPADFTDDPEKTCGRTDDTGRMGLQNLSVLSIVGQ